MSDEATVRLVQARKHFEWENLTPQACLVIQMALQIRARFDYMVRLEGFSEGILYFGIRDARNVLHPGSAEHFASEIKLMTGGLEVWVIEPGTVTETIAVSMSE